MNNNFIVQRPTPPNSWLWSGDEKSKYFTDCVIRPVESKPWSECTDKEKLAWEETHKPEEPQAEVVE